MKKKRQNNMKKKIISKTWKMSSRKTKNYKQYDLNNQIPHDLVHGKVGGQMGSTAYAAYDPIFYLHHSFVDLQYAYWQALQTLRVQPLKSSFKPYREMPPFSDLTPDNHNINPIQETKEHCTQYSTIDYKTNYNYEYDQLIIDGKTPEGKLSQNFIQKQMMG